MYARGPGGWERANEEHDRTARIAGAVTQALRVSPLHMAPVPPNDPNMLRLEAGETLDGQS